MYPYTIKMTYSTNSNACPCTEQVGTEIERHRPESKLLWGGSDEVIGMQGQEWDIEANSRLRIMDHLPIKFTVPMGCALSHIWHT